MDYIYGRADKNSDIQIIGLALGQAALLGLAISSGLKVVTGWKPPSKLVLTDDLHGDFRFGFLKGGVNSGWPISHTCVAFSMATAIIELYPNNTAIKICSFTYASLIGLDVSTNVHWASDAVAGDLIGWAIGRTVGINFRNLMNGSQKSQVYNFDITQIGVSLIINSKNHYHCIIVQIYISIIYNSSLRLLKPFLACFIHSIYPHKKRKHTINLTNFDYLSKFA